MEITTKIVITYDETKENDALECILFIFERYKGRYVIGSFIGKIGCENTIAEMDKNVLKCHFFY